MDLALPTRSKNLSSETEPRRRIYDSDYEQRCFKTHDEGMWFLVIAAAMVALLVGCWSVELSIVVVLCAGIACVLQSDAKCDRGSDRGTNGHETDSGDGDERRLAARRASRSARSARAVDSSDSLATLATTPRRRPVVREAIVHRVPLEPMVTVAPSEDVLDACVLQQQRARSHQPDARTYHTQVLPNVIRAVAAELTTPDPSIVPLGGSAEASCSRSLGIV